MFNDPNFKEEEQLKQLMLKDIKRQMNGERISEEEVYAYFRDLHHIARTISMQLLRMRLKS